MANDLNGNLPVNVKFTRNYSPIKKHIIDSHFKAIDNALGAINESIETLTIDAEAAIPTAVTIPTDPTGGTTTDAEARTAINGINDALGEIETALGAIVAALVAHGIVEEEV